MKTKGKGLIIAGGVIALVTAVVNAMISTILIAFARGAAISNIERSEMLSPSQLAKIENDLATMLGLGTFIWIASAIFLVLGIVVLVLSGKPQRAKACTVIGIILTALGIALIVAISLYAVTIAILYIANLLAGVLITAGGFKAKKLLLSE